MKKILGIMLIGVLIAGCTHTYGNKKVADENLQSKIKPGVTTKVEVESLFGKPGKVTFTDTEEEIWDYTYYRSDIRGTSFIPCVGLFVGGADTKVSTLTIKFRKDGVVKSFGAGKTTGAGGGLQDRNK